jgi:hypothetical protein
MMRAAFRAVMAAALIAVAVEGVVVLLFVDTLRRYGLFDGAIDAWLGAPRCPSASQRASRA